MKTIKMNLVTIGKAGCGCRVLYCEAGGIYYRIILPKKYKGRRVKEFLADILIDGLCAGEVLVEVGDYVEAGKVKWPILDCTVERSDEEEEE